MKLRQSIEKYLWLVGEYLYVENMGCAHGAYSLGAKAATEIIREMKKWWLTVIFYANIAIKIHMIIEIDNDIIDIIMA